MLLVLAAVPAATGGRVGFITYRLCAPIFALSAVLILVGAFAEASGASTHLTGGVAKIRTEPCRRSRSCKSPAARSRARAWHQPATVCPAGHGIRDSDRIGRCSSGYESRGARGFVWPRA